MGGQTTKLFRNFSSNTLDNEEQSNKYVSPQSDESVVNNSISPFVYFRRGSMYIDEDGDVAHEFYVETKEGSKVTLKQISNQNLTPQGDILLDVPCLRSDYPIILLDQNKSEE